MVELEYYNTDSHGNTINDRKIEGAVLALCYILNLLIPYIYLCRKVFACELPSVPIK